MIDDMKLRALEQAMLAGRKGLIIERGWESATQMSLVEEGLLWQEVAGRKHWKFTLSPSGESILDSHHKLVGRPVPKHGSGP